MTDNADVRQYMRWEGVEAGRLRAGKEARPGPLAGEVRRRVVAAGAWLARRA